MNSPIKTHGGKHYLAKEIVKLAKQARYTHYAEPFFGGGSVLFEFQHNGISETVNDLNKNLTNFWECIRHKETFEQFYDQINSTPFSELEFDKAKNLLNYEGSDPKFVIVKRALAFFTVNKQSRQGIGKSYATPTTRTRRGMNEHVSAWLTSIEGLPEIHNRLKTVEIRNMDFRDFIKKYDHTKCLFYLDPPYLHSTRTATNVYEFEMQEKDHVDLLGLISSLRGSFILSGYQSNLYDTYARKNGWKKNVYDIDNKASSDKTKEIKQECVWYNFR